MLIESTEQVGETSTSFGVEVDLPGTTLEPPALPSVPGPQEYSTGVVADLEEDDFDDFDEEDFDDDFDDDFEDEEDDFDYGAQELEGDLDDDDEEDASFDGEEGS